jgi:hypothetical protein
LLQARKAKEEAQKAPPAYGVVDKKAKEPKKAKEDGVLLGVESDEDDESKGAKPM